MIIYINTEKGSVETISVVCGIIWKDNKVFIARRRPEKQLGGYWEFPGGKVEVNETHEESLIRELHEELGMKVIIEKPFLSVRHSYENFIIELYSFWCQFIGANFKMTDHDKFEWIAIEELENRKLAPADIPIANELKAKY